MSKTPRGKVCCKRAQKSPSGLCSALPASPRGRWRQGDTRELETPTRDLAAAQPPRLGQFVPPCTIMHYHALSIEIVLGILGTVASAHSAICHHLPPHTWYAFALDSMQEAAGVHRQCRRALLGIIWYRSPSVLPLFSCAVVSPCQIGECAALWKALMFLCLVEDYASAACEQPCGCAG